jgi:hypothetical protein
MYSESPASRSYRLREVIFEDGNVAERVAEFAFD